MIEMPTNSDKKIVLKKCIETENVSKYIGNSTIIKNIYLKDKLVNFITKK